MRRGEVPLAQDKSEAVETSEDKGVAEAAEQGEEGNDGLSDEEEVRPPHERQDVLHVEALEEATPDLVRTVDVRIFARLAPALGFLVEKHRGTGLRDGEEVDSLDDTAEDELSVEDPAPVEVLRDEAANNRSHNGAGAGREDDIEHGELLVLGAEHIGDHAKGDTATSGRQTAEDTGRKDSVEVWRQHAGNLEDVDETERGLHDPLATKLLREGSPEFAAETVSDEEGRLTETGLEMRDAEVLGHTGNGVGVDGGIVVHANLNPEDHGENSPFLHVREGESENGRSGCVLVGELDARVPALVECELGDSVRVLLDSWIDLHFLLLWIALAG